MLKNVKFCVFALGHSDYGDKVFCAAGAELDKHLAALSGQRILTVGFGDEAGLKSKLTQGGGQEEEFDAWTAALMRKLKESSGGCNNGLVTEQDASDDEYE